MGLQPAALHGRMRVFARMSISSDRGKKFELKVAALIRRKLGARVMRDRRSGAGINRSDMSDYYNDIPLHIEVKDQQTVKIKEWYEQACAASSFARTPVVVYHDDDLIMCALEFSNLLNFILEIADQKAEIDDLRTPTFTQPAKPTGLTVDDAINGRVASVKAGVAVPAVNDVPKTVYCREGHLADEYGYCMQLSCKYSRGYRKPKSKKSH